MILGLLTGVAILFVAGACVLRLLGISVGRAGDSVLAIALGLGLTSITFFVSVLLGVSRLSYVGLEIAVVIALAVVTNRRRDRVSAVSSPSEPLERGDRLVQLACAVLLLTTLASFVSVTLAFPHGTFDGLAIWNLRARNLALSVLEGFSFNLMEMGSGHPGYPYLLSASIARLEVFAGRLTTAAPTLLAAFFTYGSVMLLWAMVGRLRSRRVALLGALLLLAAPRFFSSGSEQLADVPLGFFELAVIAMVFIEDTEGRDSWSFPLLIGLLCGLAAWTKNEGLPFALAVALTVVIRRHGLKDQFRWLSLFALGSLPFAVANILLKLLTRTAGRSGLEQLTDPERLAMIVISISRNMIPLLPALLCALILGFDRERARSRSFVSASAVIALTILSWVIYYLITPSDLARQLALSAGRLVMQITPAAVFVVTMILRSLPARSVTALHNQ